MDARLQEPESTEKSLSHSLMTAFDETPDSVFAKTEGAGRRTAAFRRIIHSTQSLECHWSSES